jgi:hypothetical protein
VRFLDRVGYMIGLVAGYVTCIHTYVVHDGDLHPICRVRVGSTPCFFPCTWWKVDLRGGIRACDEYIGYFVLLSIYHGFET